MPVTTTCSQPNLQVTTEGGAHRCFYVVLRLKQLIRVKLIQQLILRGQSFMDCRVSLKGTVLA